MCIYRSFSILTLILIINGLASSAVSASPTQILTDGYLGSQQCNSCHQKQFELWLNSDHQKAMQHASNTTVLGRFDHQLLEYYGFNYRFLTREDGYYVEADNQNGDIKQYKIRFTFGVDPLQQYLVETDKGKLQALPVAWDTRPASEGGQRWFHLYPDQKIDSNDTLHWTGLNQNWNYMCADCHSTNLKKNYDANTKSYNTTWSEISVGCEACHGPGEQHIAWAKNAPLHSATGISVATDKGIHLPLPPPLKWQRSEHKATATPEHQPETNKISAPNSEVENCARCHSRRLQLKQHHVRDSLHDSYNVSLLSEELYHADGQIKDEVFEYGSFIQSKMHQQGVTCSNCHDPHSQKLRLPGAQVCSLCHQQETYESIEHHFHTVIPGSRRLPDCLDCHMPTKKYMVVDPRRDHSFRVPRPDLAQQFNSPDVCLNCHTGKNSRWSADNVNQWLGRDSKGLQNYAEILAAARKGETAAELKLIRLIENAQQPAIARATALQLLQPYLSHRSIGSLINSVTSSEPLIRKAAVKISSTLATADRIKLLPPLLDDPLLGIRIEVARLLTGSPQQHLSAEQAVKLASALEEFKHVQEFNSDRPESHLNLGNLYTQQEKLKLAEKTYHTALQLDNKFTPAKINLIELLRSQGLKRKSEQMLSKALELSPNDPALHMNLGYYQIRNKQQSDAINSFRKAVQLAPDNSRYRYIYGVALQSSGQKEAGLKQLEHAYKLFKANPELIRILLQQALNKPDYPKALSYAEKLLNLEPDNLQLQSLLEELDRNANK